MESIHKIYYQNSNNLSNIESNSVDLVVTSPPYPMIEMWDKIFSTQNPSIKDALNNYHVQQAFEKMHQELDKIWNELFRVLKDGAIACINIGDATRTINKKFQLFSNHSRILTYCLKSGFTSLPLILWRKQTNAPNKFMGSGMLPANAYVTLEHEYILILRKGSNRIFKNDNEKKLRKESSFFWEERNNWFSDVWHFKGTNQSLNNKNTRNRSGAFPFELAYRLINMFSIKGDMVLDPFLGTGTTTLASITSGRNSIGIEIDDNFNEIISPKFEGIISFSNNYIRDRIYQHNEFVKNYLEQNKKLKYMNKNYNFPVMTQQETDILINMLSDIEKIDNNTFKIIYEDKLLRENKSLEYQHLSEFDSTLDEPVLTVF